MKGATETDERLQTRIGWWISGLVNNLAYSLMLSAAEDLLEGSGLATGVVLLCDIMPTLIIKITAPFYMQRLSYAVRVCIVVASALIGFQLAGWCDSVALKLLGVIFCSISAGAGEITFLAYSSYFNRAAISAWSSGTGMAGLGASGCYALLTIGLDISPKTAILSLCWLPLLEAAMYFRVIERRTELPSALSSRSLLSSTASPLDSPNAIDVGTAVSAIEAESTDSDDLMVMEMVADTRPAVTQTMPLSESVGSRAAHWYATSPSASPSSFISSLSLKERVSLVKPLLWRYMAPLFLVYLCEYTINSGVGPVTYWLCDGCLSPRDAFVVYN
ncbi:Batten's disease protein Cln3, partial [Kipferlia bialata]